MPSEGKPLPSHPTPLMQVSAQLLHLEPMCLRPCRQLDLITVPTSDHLPDASPGAAVREEAFAVGLSSPSSSEPQPRRKSPHWTQPTRFRKVLEPSGKKVTPVNPEGYGS